MTYRSPYARKVRIALLEKGVSFEEITIDLTQKPKDFLTQNPLGTVPSLKIPQGPILNDSTLILHYLEETFPDPKLVPEAHRWEIWNWEEMADRLCDLHVAVFYAAKSETQKKELIEKADAMSALVVDTMAKQLQDREYLFGDYSLADIALGAVFKWMEFRLKKDGSSPQVLNWLARLDTKNSFQKTIPRLD